MLFLLPLSSFTIHFATINTDHYVIAEKHIKNLQYTLLLLILSTVEDAGIIIPNLQYTLLLLIQNKMRIKSGRHNYLQYTLLLLILLHLKKFKEKK